MSKTFEVIVLTREAHDFIHIVFNVDKLWRRLATSAVARKINRKRIFIMHQEWEKLISEMKQFLDVLWVQFQCWTVEHIEGSSNFKKLLSIQKKQSGKIYHADIHTEVGRVLLSQCKSLDNCFIILHSLRVNEENISKIAKIKEYYQGIKTNFEAQYDTDMKVLEKSLKYKPQYPHNVRRHIRGNTVTVKKA
jgi:hypothetical protein